MSSMRWKGCGLGEQGESEVVGAWIVSNSEHKAHGQSQHSAPTSTTPSQRRYTTRHASHATACAVWRDQQEWDQDASRTHWDTDAPQHGTVTNLGFFLSLAGCDRWQGPSPRPSCVHCGQAAAERPEDRGRPHRGPQHLRRVLPL